MKVLLFLLLLANVFYSQEKCNFTFDEKSGKKILIGEIKREEFNDTVYSVWFSDEYENYLPDKLVIDTLKNKLRDYEIEIIFGTWCSDSRREVPRFLKILDLCSFPEENIRMIAVDRNKTAGNFNIGDKKILLVPTFIVYKSGKEKGRIIEVPDKTLERDLLKILN
ncbi:hypothetical protein [Melioribacter sp. OK-6-Me]|uniref:hypothetical protein n=1 Tax=unclassified Melioribacter TaxID=2627329 RepID=UPI003EDB4F18